MAHVQPEEIQAALDTKKPVWSRAAGRFGRITRVDGNCVEFRAGLKGKGQKCVTFFHCGDHTRLTEFEDCFVVSTDFDAMTEA